MKRGIGIAAPPPNMPQSVPGMTTRQLARQQYLQNHPNSRGNQPQPMPAPQPQGGEPGRSTDRFSSGHQRPGVQGQPQPWGQGWPAEQFGGQFGGGFGAGQPQPMPRPNPWNMGQFQPGQMGGSWGYQPQPLPQTLPDGSQRQPGDPNRYTMGPNGQMIGTLIGWNQSGQGGMGSQMSQQDQQQRYNDLVSRGLVKSTGQQQGAQKNYGGGY